jgi:hypothetical protein
MITGSLNMIVKASLVRLAITAPGPVCGIPVHGDILYFGEAHTNRREATTFQPAPVRVLCIMQIPLNLYFLISRSVVNDGTYLGSLSIFK